MLLGSLVLALCPSGPASGQGAPTAAPGSTSCEPAGSLQERKKKDGIEWFEGDYTALLEAAREKDQLVFLDFWAQWCDWCRKLEDETFADPRVAEGLGRLLCFSVDTGTDAGAAVARRFDEPALPALIFLEPDGEIRDVLIGFLAPDEFLRELERIERNEGTVGSLRKRVEETPDDVALRYELAIKLESIGDKQGYKAEVAAIRRLDPEARTVPMRRIRLDEIVAHLQKDLVLDPLYDFLEAERDEVLLFHGWYAAWRFEDYLCRKATWSDDEDTSRDHAQRWVRATHTLWKYVPDERHANLGNTIAWLLYENQSRLGDADKAFALEVARKAAAAACGEAAVIDTLACCLYMNGRKDEAIETVKLCIELEPENVMWRRRLKDFTR